MSWTTNPQRKQTSTLLTGIKFECTHLEGEVLVSELVAVDGLTAGAVAALS